jgi:hypothetical protein
MLYWEVVKMSITVEHYLRENIDEDVEIKPWFKENNLPVFLRSNYNFYEMMILGTQCIFIFGGASAMEL